MMISLLIFAFITDFMEACHNSPHLAAARARARGVRTSKQHVTNSSVVELDNFEIISCDGLNYVPFSAYELRHTAALSLFPDEAELKVSDGGRITCSFDKPQEYCSWVNVPEEQFRFWIAKYDIPFDRLRFDCTSQQTLPFEGGFLMAGGEPAVGAERVSTEVHIPCQLGEATLKFNYWTNSDEIILRYCVTTEQEAKCQDILPQQNPYNITIREQFVPFALRLEAINMYSNTLVLIDNLYYEGKICEFVDEIETSSTFSVPVTVDETTIPNNFGFSEPMPNPGQSNNFETALSAVNGNSKSTQENENQNQDQRSPDYPNSISTEPQSPNSEQPQQNWDQNHNQNQISLDYGNSIPTETQSSTHETTGWSTESSSRPLESDYWTTSDETSTIPSTATTSESSQNFFLGNNFGLGIQPIQQAANHFRPELPISFVQPTTTESAPESFLEDLEGISSDATELSACEALRCDFNLGHTCFFNTRGIGSTAAWATSDTLTGNRHTGIQRVNLKDAQKIGYAYIGEDNRDHSDDIFVLESPKFSLKTNAYLVFDIYIRSKGPKLKICFESFDYCPYSSPSVLPQYFWQEQRVFVQPGIRKIYFLGESVNKNLFLAIDNLRIEGESGEQIC